MEQTSIYDQEIHLLTRLSETYTPEERELLVWDGLCGEDIHARTNDRSVHENQWRNSNRRILILGKEPNSNEGEDYREFLRADATDSFCRVAGYWIDGIMRATKNWCPNYWDINERKDIFNMYPFAFVNVKKLPGGASSDWSTIWSAAERDQKFLREQIRDILAPNIIVCCGSNDSGNEYTKMISIAKQYIFPDIASDFSKINDWCYYNANKDLLLIDSYHPSARMSDEEKVNGLVEAFHEFLIKSNVDW